MKLADGREKPRRSEKRRAGERRRKGESWWGALERVEWVRGVSFEPLNFAKFETVRGRGDSPSDVHSASTLLLPSLLSLSLCLAVSLSRFLLQFAPHLPLPPPSLSLSLFLLLPARRCTTVLAAYTSPLLFLLFSLLFSLLRSPRSVSLARRLSLFLLLAPPTPLPPPKPRFGVPSQPSWYYGNFEPIRKSIVPARKPRGGLRCNHRSLSLSLSSPECIQDRAACFKF